MNILKKVKQTFLLNYQMPIYKYKGVDCVSAGVIFYRFTDDGAIELLMQLKQDKRTLSSFWEDLGGKSDPEDQSIEDVAAREAAEESNAKISNQFSTTYDEQLKSSRNYIRELIKKNSIALLQKKTKYALFLVYLPEKHHKLDFGSSELHPKWQIHRTLEWIRPRDVFKNVKKIHPRIRHVLKFF
jgi:8-oxo-dGTP pyrophosphatase MutT (NUDIX family)